MVVRRFDPAPRINEGGRCVHRPPCELARPRGVSRSRTNRNGRGPTYAPAAVITSALRHTPRDRTSLTGTKPREARRPLLEGQNELH
jgi:hypothetical protein